MEDNTEKMRQMTWDGVWTRRLARHGLLNAMQEAKPADVVDAMCGAHAQVMSAAEISVALRIDSATRSHVREALWQEHSLVKTFGPRGTVHLLPARDLAMWTGALSALPRSRNDLPEEALMTPEQTDAVVEAIATMLSDKEMTVDEMDEAIVDMVGGWAGDEVVPAWYGMYPRWRPAMYTAANRGVLCYGPRRKRKVTYTNPQRWLPGFQPDEGQEALRDLVVCYLHAYGPATPQQFAQWMATPITWAAELFDSLGAELEQVSIEGDVAWIKAGDGEVPAKATEGVRLLPYFDAFVVGGQPREMLFPGRAAERALANGQAGNYPVLLIDGVVSGVWHLRRAGRTLHIRVEPLEPLSAALQRALEEQVARIGEILEGKPKLTIGTIDVGPHA
ncbi:MAG: winged helix DNA-binding domain-containing protein [Chloroflexota bacterium]